MRFEISLVDLIARCGRPNALLEPIDAVSHDGYVGSAFPALRAPSLLCLSRPPPHIALLPDSSAERSAMATDTDIALLRDNFELVLQRDQEFPRRWYEILFERHPDIKALFVRNSPGAQHALVAQTLMAIIDHYEDSAWVDQKLDDLGRKHVEYGATPEMYDWVGDALISALAEVSAGDWTEAHKAAWSATYQEMAARMLRAASVAALDAPQALPPGDPSGKDAAPRRA